MAECGALECWLRAAQRANARHPGDELADAGLALLLFAGQQRRAVGHDVAVHDRCGFGVRTIFWCAVQWQPIAGGFGHTGKH